MAVLSFALPTFEAFAQGHEATVEEVFNAELVFPQEKGTLQVLMAPGLHAKSGNRSGYTPLMVEYGLTDALQAEVAWSGPRYTSAHEPSALEIGVKYSFIDIASRPIHVALGVEYLTPLISREANSELEVFVVLARTFQESGMQVFFQVGKEWGIGESDASDLDDEEGMEGSLHLGFVYPGGRVHVTGEFSMLEEKGLNQRYLTPGFVFGPIEGWQLGIGLPIGITESSDSFRIITFITCEFELFGVD